MNLGRYFSSIQGGDYHVFPDGRVLMSGAHILSDSIRGFEGMYNLIWFSNEGYLDTTRTHRYCDEVIFAIEEQPDGKFLCSGTMHTYEDQPVRCIFRIQPDGGLDPTFQADLQWGEAITFTTLTDGRILAGGPLKRIGSEDTLNLVRMMPDGSLDPSFVLNDFERSYDENALYLVSSITPMANGNMIVTGSFDRINGSDRGGIALLGPDGELLSELFEGTGCGMYEYVTPSGSSIYKSIRGIVSAPDGSYYIYGAYHGYDDGTTNDTAQRMVSRLHGLDVGEREDQDRNSAIHILPNPGTDKLTITTDLALLPGSIVQLVDAQGRVIAATTLASAQTGWYIGEVAPGCYVLRFLDGTHRTHAIKWVRTDR